MRLPHNKIGDKIMTIKHKGAILLLALATGSAIAQIPNAHADESTFVNQLDAIGVTVTPSSIPLGHAICSSISSDGYSGVDDAMRSMYRAGLSADESAAFVVFAGHELCPSTLPAIIAWAGDHR